jgi:hypothetical protein
VGGGCAGGDRFGVWVCFDEEEQSETCAELEVGKCPECGAWLNTMAQLRGHLMLLSEAATSRACQSSEVRVKSGCRTSDFISRAAYAKPSLSVGKRNCHRTACCYSKRTPPRSHAPLVNIQLQSLSPLHVHR